MTDMPLEKMVADGLIEHNIAISKLPRPGGVFLGLLQYGGRAVVIGTVVYDSSAGTAAYVPLKKDSPHSEVGRQLAELLAQAKGDFHALQFNPVHQASEAVEKAYSGQRLSA